LDLKNTLLQNAVGIVHCGYEFVESGFVRMLCEKLPFEVVGCTTLACATNGSCGSDMLSVTVLTGDDVTFSVARSEPLSRDNIDVPLGAVYRRAAAALPEEAALILAYLPLDVSIGISPMLKGITAVCGDVPVFGGLPCDGTPDYGESVVICNGEVFPDAAALILLGGNVRPRFFIENIGSSGSLQEQYGVITESDGCLLKSVNDMPFLDYIADIGLSPEAIRETKAFPVPFKINYSEGTQSLVRVLFSVTPEGHAVFTNDMPEGCSFAMQRLDYNSVLETAENMANKLSALRDVSGVLLYSCIGRNFLLGLKTSDEIRKLMNVLGDKPVYSFCYAGGELCPVEEDETHTLVSHSHSYSLIACVF
jgi:hypothetical protein